MSRRGLGVSIYRTYYNVNSNQWRRGRDSNPGNLLQLTRFPSVLLKPARTPLRKANLELLFYTQYSYLSRIFIMEKYAVFCYNALSLFLRRGGRAVECGGLESHCTLTGTGGSNPLPSAIGDSQAKSRELTGFK